MYNYALLIHETAFTGFGESVTIFEDFLNDFPNSQYADKVNDYLVEVYLTTKNYDAALKSIEKIKHPSVKILDAKQNILFQLGTEAFTNMKMDEAIDLFTRAIQMGTYNEEARSDAYFWRGESNTETRFPTTGLIRTIHSRKERICMPFHSITWDIVISSSRNMIWH